MSIRFILNPVSGGKQAPADYLVKCVRANFPQAELCLTKRAGHATELAAQAVAENFDAVVAMGGDGTINEVARALVGTNTALGVIARGSGNGFAREIGMHLTPEAALLQLQRAKTLACDVGYANGELFLNVAGVGIEAEVAWKFKEYGTRGMWPYFVIGTQTILSYQPKILDVTFDGQQEILQPLTLVFANGKQYGSNFKIAPEASLQDGLLDMVTVRNISKWKLALAAPYFFTDKQRPFHVTDTRTVKKAVILHAGEILYHIDGEPRKTTNKLEIELKPKALRVLVPTL